MRRDYQEETIEATMRLAKSEECVRITENLLEFLKVEKVAEIVALSVEQVKRIEEKKNESFNGFKEFSTWE